MPIPISKLISLISQESAEHYNRMLSERAQEIQELRKQLSEREHQLVTSERQSSTLTQEGNLETAELRALLAEKDSIINVCPPSRDTTHSLIEHRVHLIQNMKAEIVILCKAIFWFVLLQFCRSFFNVVRRGTSFWQICGKKMGLTTFWNAVKLFSFCRRSWTRRKVRVQNSLTVSLGACRPCRH